MAWGEDSNACQIVANTLSCAFGDLAAGATRTVHVSGVTDAADCGTLPNTATVAATNEPAAKTGDDQSSASIVVQCPDVTVLKTADHSPISAGDTAAFTIVVSNAGPGLAKAVTLNDPLPAGVAWSEDSADCQIASNTLACSFGDLGVGASRTIHVSGPTDAADCGTLPNTATVAATNEPSSKLGNNVSSASIVRPVPRRQGREDGYRRLDQLRRDGGLQARHLKRGHGHRPRRHARRPASRWHRLERGQRRLLDRAPIRARAARS